jgi:hypothetical protein
VTCSFAVRKLTLKPQINAVISTSECNTSDLIMDEEVLAWQKEEDLGCPESRSLSYGLVGRQGSA